MSNLRETVLSVAASQNGVLEESQNKTSPLDSTDLIQSGVAINYLHGLIACIILWVIKDFSSDPKVIVSMISGLEKMIAVVVLAYIWRLL